MCIFNALTIQLKVVFVHFAVIVRDNRFENWTDGRQQQIKNSQSVVIRDVCVYVSSENPESV